MKLLLATLLLFQSPDGDRERGLELYRKGQYAEAQRAFARAAEASPESAELQWNLALAAWRAGDLTTAETAAEKYAALDPDSKPELHRGLLGAVRYAEAERLAQEAEAARAGQAPPVDGAEPADPLPLYEKALQQAFQAKNQFVRGARANPTPELLRNTERSLRKVDELKQRIEQLMQERQQQQPQQGGKPQQQDPQQQDPQQQDPQQGEQQPQQQQGEPQEPQPGQTEPGEQQPGEPQPGESQPGEPQPGEPQPREPQPGEPQPGEPEPGQPEPGQPRPAEPPTGAELESDKPRTDAPGEAAEGLELTPEQAQRLLERLRELDEKLKQARARSRGGRRPVERDW